MVVAGKSAVEAKRVCNAVCIIKVALSTLVHCDVCLFEPTLLLKVSLEGCEETCPQILVIGRTCIGCDILVTACSLVVVAETHIPRYHAEAVDLLVYIILGAEFDVFVKNCIVILPRAVGLLYCLYHRVEEVMCLLAPRFIEENCCNATLTCAAKSSKIRTQSLEVLVTPTLYLVVAAYRIGLLPQVEVEFLFCHCRQ